MKRLLCILPLCLTAGTALAQDCPSWQAGDLTITNAWSRAAPSEARPGVFYVEIANGGAQDDALVAITTPVAAKPMLHETVITDGVARMGHAMSIPVPAGGSASLAPGGHHGMLMGLQQVLEEGHSFPLTLTFEKAGEVEIEVGIAGTSAKEAPCAQTGG